MNGILNRDDVKKIEAAHFRTNEDTGANLNALFIWNIVREHVGLPRLDKDDLPAYCKTHDKYHIIKNDYDCSRKLTRL